MHRSIDFILFFKGNEIFQEKFGSVSGRDNKAPQFFQSAFEGFRLLIFLDDLHLKHHVRYYAQENLVWSFKNIQNEILPLFLFQSVLLGKVIFPLCPLRVVWSSNLNIVRKGKRFTWACLLPFWEVILEPESMSLDNKPDLLNLYKRLPRSVVWCLLSSGKHLCVWAISEHSFAIVWITMRFLEDFFFLFFFNHSFFVSTVNLVKRNKIVFIIEESLYVYKQE